VFGGICMQKKKYILFSLIGLIFLTGCGSKTCAKWETTSVQLDDCAKYEYGSNQRTYCELKNSNKKQTQTCVEWVK
jgi:hypothetical protein